MVIWLIGLSGSGKTTIARALYDMLKPEHRALVLVDGDEVRDVFPRDTDHTVEGRRRNAERISPLCAMLDRQDIHVIAAVLSIFPEWQKWNRETFSAYHEVFLDIPLEELERRDPKGLYSKARAGEMPNVVGLDIPFPRPPAPDQVLTLADQADGVEACARKILRTVSAFDK